MRLTQATVLILILTILSVWWSVIGGKSEERDGRGSRFITVHHDFTLAPTCEIRTLTLVAPLSPIYTIDFGDSLQMDVEDNVSVKVQCRALDTTGELIEYAGTSTPELLASSPLNYISKLVTERTLRQLGGGGLTAARTEEEQLRFLHPKH